ncbi:MAG: hypothetical protein IAG13_27095 [Deltaproteobacteria bacterium]|nr:hypothetical protein [Nannocystaceae bacterium]
MGLHRRQLPIASPCERFEGTEATAEQAAFCTRCDKHVHDLSRLTEPEVVELLARHRDREVCVSYRTRADGTIALRKAPPRLAPAAMALAMTGCAGHLSEPDARASDCVDAGGYHIDCPPSPRLGMAVIPDAALPVDPVEPSQADVPAEIHLGELGELADESMVRGGISGSLVLEPPELEAAASPELPLEPATDAGDFMGLLLKVRPAGRLARKVEREAKRIDRRERRALAKR